MIGVWLVAQAELQEPAVLARGGMWIREVRLYKSPSTFRGLLVVCWLCWLLKSSALRSARIVAQNTDLRLPCVPPHSLHGNHG